MTSRIHAFVTATFLLGACAFVQAAPAPHNPAGTLTTWTVYTNVVGPASLVGHGSLLPVSPVVNEGDTATLTITPDPGYLLTSVDLSQCGGAANGDGTWTTDTVLGDCTLTATFALSASDVIFQGDLDPDITVVDDVNLNIPQTWLGASINYETGATCTGTPAKPCGNAYHFRPAANYDHIDPVLVFRYMTGDDWVIDDSYRSYGIVGYSAAGDEQFSQPLQSGGSIGPEQTFVFPTQGFETAPWHAAAGLDAYVGFRFLNSKTGLVNYGYTHLVTSPQDSPTPTGFPATIVGYAYNRRGAPIKIP
jgi:hypothetical protein